MPSGIFSVSEAVLKDMGFVKTMENGSTYYGTAENPYSILLDADDSSATFSLNGNTKVIAESAFNDYPLFESIKINGDSKYFINIMRKCCDYWGVNYNSYFDKMCEYAYEEG